MFICEISGFLVTYALIAPNQRNSTRVLFSREGYIFPPAEIGEGDTGGRQIITDLKDTLMANEERVQIVAESLGNISGSCDGPEKKRCEVW